MRHYRHNARWLVWFAPFRSLSISAAYLTPFFVEHGLDTTQIFLLQSIFSAAYLLWEIPSSMLADRFGRAFCIKLSAPISAVGMIAYGMSGQFWQFVACELVLALSNGLISGIDTALLDDSLKAEGRGHEFTRIQQRIDGLGFASTAVGVGVAIPLVHFWGVGSTIIADGLTVLPGLFFVLRLADVDTKPKISRDKKANKPQRNLARGTARQALREFVANPTVRWLITLRSTLSTATYLAFWLSALYYRQLGIPVVAFGAILAVRSGWKWLLSHYFHQEKHIGRNMVAYAGLAGAAYLAMATGQLWLLPAVLGHDIVQALGSSPLTRRLNQHITAGYRATCNSVANLTQRLAYTIAGPLAGLLADHTSLSTAFVALGLTSSALALTAIWRLHRLDALR